MESLRLRDGLLVEELAEKGSAEEAARSSIASIWVA